MASLSDVELLNLARRTLQCSPIVRVPEHYLGQLKDHLRLYPHDTRFSVTLQPNTGYGRLTCFEQGCNNLDIDLSRNTSAPLGGKTTGFGSFRAYQTHIQTHPTHAAQRHARVQSQAHGPASSIPHQESSRPLSIPTAAPKKRLSGDLIDPMQPSKRIKVEADTPNHVGQGNPSKPGSLTAFKPYVDAVGADEDIKPYVIANNVVSGQNKPTHVKQEHRQPHLPLAPISNAPTSIRSTLPPDATSRLTFLRNQLANSERNLQAYLSLPSSSRTAAVSAQTIERLREEVRAMKQEVVQQQLFPSASASRAVKVEVKPEPKEERLPTPPPMQFHAARVVPVPHVPQKPVNHIYKYEEIESGAEESEDQDEVGAVIDKIGTIGDFGSGPSAVSTGKHGDDFNAFLIAAGNAETFEQNATVHDALKTLRMKHLDADTPFKNMTVSLLPHQCIGVAWMTEQEKGRNKGGIMADEMGLGKTVQMMATCSFNLSRDPMCKTTLVIGPVATLRQWRDEIQDKLARHNSVLIYHGSGKNAIKSLKDFSKYDYVLTTFGTVGVEWPGNVIVKKMKKAMKKKKSGDDFMSESEEEVKKKDSLLFAMGWYRVVLDEAQNIRNKSTRNSTAVTDLKAIYRWALTGTPLVNSTADAYGLLRFLKIRPWYDWSEFRTEILSLERSNPGLATRRLQAIFRLCLLRRNKDSELQGKRLIELPDKNYNLDTMAFSQPEQEIYNMLQRRSRAVFNQFLRQGTVLKNYAHVFVLLLRLRQCAVHPALIGEFEDAFICEGEERPSGEVQDPMVERRRAIGVMGVAWVEMVCLKFKDRVLERMRMEKESVDAAIQVECPICMEPMVAAQVTPCMHEFCPDCIVRVLNAPQVQDGGNDQIIYAANERPCPSCRAAFSDQRLFQQSAFEPSNVDLGIVTNSDEDDEALPPAPSSKLLKKLQKHQDGESSSEEEDNTPIKRKGKGKAKPKSGTGSRRTSRSKQKPKKYTFVNEDSDDSMDDFIMKDDESESEKDRKRDARQKKLEKLKSASQKKKPRRIDSDEDEYVGSASEAEESEEDEESDISEDYRELKPRQAKIFRMPPNLSKFLPSTKMKKMMELLKQWKEEFPEDKTMIVSQWTSVLQLVEFYLHEQGFKYELYTGGMSGNARHQAVQNFMHNEDITVLLMSLTAGGVGLNLTRANRVISLDFAWSEAVEAQAFDRTHRLGQRKEVEIHRLAIQHTVEEKVMALQDKKKGLADGSLGEGKGVKLGRLTVRELANLFGLDARGRIIEN